VLKGSDYLKQSLSTLTKGPGVYQMLGAEKRPLYIGKAKNISKRVASYTQPARLSRRIQLMVAQIRGIEVIQTRNESEALLLEAHLIHKHQPPYNVVLKDNKSLPYLHLSEEKWAQLKRCRGVEKKKGIYFGPFASVREVTLTQKALQRVFMLRTCSDHTLYNRTRPCLQYHIKRCSAPCVGKISEPLYKKSVTQLKAFLDGRSAMVQESLREEMHAFSKKQAYEKAAAVHARLKALVSIQQKQALFLPLKEPVDVLGLFRQHNRICLYVFFFRGGQLLGGTPLMTSWVRARGEEDAEREVCDALKLPKKVQVPKPTNGCLTHVQNDLEAQDFCMEDNTSEDCLKSKMFEPLHQPSASLFHLEERLFEENVVALMVQFYKSNPPPKVLITLHLENQFALLQTTLSVMSGEKIVIRKPLNSQERDVCELAQKNAEKTLQLAHNAVRENSACLKDFEKWLKSTKPFKRVEVYDNSHLKGTHAYGAMITATPYGFDKKSYRLFKIPPTLNAQDDYGFMRYVIKRRFEEAAHTTDTKASSKKASSKNKLPLPDVIIVDGGKGHVSVVAETLKALRMDIPLIGIAKGPSRGRLGETFYNHKKERLTLETNSPLFFYLERLRDEAHRFALKAHQTKRAKAFTSNTLETLEGLGPKRRKRLFDSFGSLQNLKEAPLTQIVLVKGISKALAEKIYEFLRKND